MKTAIEHITDERIFKQIGKHGFTAEHHANNPQWYDKGQLIEASIKLSYTIPNDEAPFNWDEQWFTHMCKKSHQDRLIISATLLAAEWDRVDYLNRSSTNKETLK